MRLDRYIGEEPKFKVLRRQPDGSYKEVPAFDYFVLKLADMNTPGALKAYAAMAYANGDNELAADMTRLSREAYDRSDRKIPD